MLTGELRNQVDTLWNAFWSGGIANPMEVLEQITYLLFLRRIDDLHTLEENKAQRLGGAMERRIYPDGVDDRGRDFNALRWSRFKNCAGQAISHTLIGCLIADSCSKALGGKLPSLECSRALL
jgi:type I restriction enzyme M protein